MTKFYSIRFSEKDKGWVIKVQQQSYTYVRVSKSPFFPDIESAEKYIRSLHDTSYGYWIDHEIHGHSGHLMTLDEWKRSCDDGGFIDDDGYGSAVDGNYSIIDMGKFDEMISPSDYTDMGGRKIPLDTKYILWYNR